MSSADLINMPKQILQELEYDEIISDFLAEGESGRVRCELRTGFNRMPHGEEVELKKDSCILDEEIRRPYRRYPARSQCSLALERGYDMGCEMLLVNKSTDSDCAEWEDVADWERTIDSDSVTCRYFITSLLQAKRIVDFRQDTNITFRAPRTWTTSPKKWRYPARI